MRLFSILILIGLTSFKAQGLESVLIPGAKCGNGSPYSVFIDQKSDEKLMVEFMGGGACWDFESCFIVPHTWIFPVPNINHLSIFSNNESELNFLKGHSKIYFPYCTGDIHVGKHIGYYSHQSKVYHNGGINVEKALSYLNNSQKIKFQKVNDLVVWGASAGGLATMIHAKKIETLIRKKANKTMIIDSPGLHWGVKFWDKFTANSLEDFSEAFDRLNVKLDYTDGFVVGELGGFFKTYKAWNVGFLLATRDFVMTTIFGDISPGDHEDLVLSKKGLPAVGGKYKNVQTWVATTNMHTFLILSKSAQMQSVDNESAIDFAQRLYLSSLREEIRK